MKEDFKTLILSIEKLTKQKDNNKISNIVYINKLTDIITKIKKHEDYKKLSIQEKTVFAMYSKIIDMSKPLVNLAIKKGQQ